MLSFSVVQWLHLIFIDFTWILWILLCILLFWGNSIKLNRLCPHHCRPCKHLNASITIQEILCYEQQDAGKTIPGAPLPAIRFSRIPCSAGEYLPCYTNIIMQTLSFKHHLMIFSLSLSIEYVSRTVLTFVVSKRLSAPNAPGMKRLLHDYSSHRFIIYAKWKHQN